MGITLALTLVLAIIDTVLILSGWLFVRALARNPNHPAVQGLGPQMAVSFALLLAVALVQLPVIDLFRVLN